MDRFMVPMAGQGAELVVVVQASPGTRITLKGHEQSQPLTLYFLRSKVLEKANEVIRIPMPLAPQSLALWIDSNQAITLKHVGVQALPRLQKERVKIGQTTADFLEHAISFVKQAGYLEAGHTYANDQNRYPIHYLNGLYNADGHRVETPARIDHRTGEIEVDATVCRGMPIPALLLILLHEWAHYHLNTKSEATADAFALKIYLDLGFSKSQGVTTYTTLFHDSQEMVSRVQKIFKRIRKYRD